MRNDSTPKGWRRSPRFEVCEPRLMMSADPIGQFRLDYLCDAPLDPAPPPSIEAEYQPAPQASLADAHRRTGVDDVQNSYGFLGGGQTVAIIDSGIAWNHAALGGGFGQDYRVVGGWDFAENDADPYDDGLAGSHGTHVAGILGAHAGANSGVAPGVDLVALRVFDDYGSGYFSYVEQALRWVHEHQDAFENPITTVNLSLGTSWNASTVPDWAMLEDEFAQLEADGIFISVAAGNAFSSYGTPGLSYPAASSYVVPVSSVDADGALSDFSQRHDRAIAAPGRSITSTVPDYAGNQNGRDDDYSSYSGTSMAAPYVAGASVLLREAMLFVGTSDITQDAIYQAMRDTADSIWDSATNAWYHRLNLEAAINSLMPDDDYGSTPDAAHQLGTLGDGATIAGTLGRLDDADYFSFTAGFTGAVTLDAAATHGMTPQWASSAGGEIGPEGGFTFDVTAGSSYHFALSTSSTIGHYSLEITTTPRESAPVSPTDWGSIEFSEFAGQSNAGEQWYRLEAGRAGILTTEAIFVHAAGNIDLELYDSSGQTLLAASQTFVGHERIDVIAAAAEVFYLKVSGQNSDIDFRLTNLVARDGERVSVFGTAQADTFMMTAGENHQLSVNGVRYAFAGSAVNEVAFHGGEGADAADIKLTAGSERAVFRPGLLNVAGADFTLTAAGIENLEVDGGGGPDVAELYDSAGDDLLVARPGEVLLRADGFQHRAVGFGQVDTFASQGFDVAHFHDSMGDDVFVSTETSAEMTSQDIVRRAEGFDRHYVHGSTGNDTAQLYDTAGDDVFTARSAYCVMVGGDLITRVDDFDTVRAYASTGFNRARFFDTAGDETFTASATFAELVSADFTHSAADFARSYAYATQGDDTAVLYDTAGYDRLDAHASHTLLANRDYILLADRFDRVEVHSLLGGGDAAHFYDSSGRETFTSTSNYVEMVGAEFHNRAAGFARNYGFSSGGGDIARLFQPSDATTATNNGWQTVQDSQAMVAAKGFLSVSSYAAEPADAAAALALDLDLATAAYDLDRLTADLATHRGPQDFAVVDELFSDADGAF